MSAGAKWLEIIADIVIYELVHASDGQLLSEFHDRWIARHPVSARVVTVGTGILLTVHLANLVDERYDPLSHAFWRNRFQQPKETAAE